MSLFSKRKKPLVLIILDGLGVAPPGVGNAVSLSKTPGLDKLWPRFPHGYLNASSLYVGLPNGVDGNSEVGHMNIGAGKVLLQDLPRIDAAIDNGSFYENKALLDAINFGKKSNIHIMGLIGNGHIHSSYGHLLAILEMLKRNNVDGNRVFLHLFTDGRDSSPTSGINILSKLEVELQRLALGKVASITGRYYGMDRDERWDRTKRAYDMMVSGVGIRTQNYIAEIQKSYDKNVTDEHLEPIVVVDSQSQPIGLVKSNDAVIFFNFREDRAVQITRAFEDVNFPGFQRDLLSNLYFVGLTDYEKGFPKISAFPTENIANPIGKIISDHGLTQLRIAESEKFPHVTYFINGGNELQYPGEDRIEVPSPRDVITYDQKPEMSAELVTNILIEKINSNIYDFIIVNYANPDMVGHTGMIEPTIKAIEFTDHCVARVVAAVLAKDGAVVLTADHGNAEEMIDPQTGEADTKHSTNPVPFMVIANNLPPRELPFGILSDIAPTCLYLLNIEKPPDMTGRNLLT